MLRNDGKYEIYIMEFSLKNKRDWHAISFDVAWVPTDIRLKKITAWEAFEASGKCWQETGVHGTYDVEDAMRLLVSLKKDAFKKDEYDFRVVKKTIWQESETVY